jgi:hypothetical protein
VLAAEAEFTARAKGKRTRGPGFPAGHRQRVQFPEFTADELACELHLTAQSAAGQMD